MINFNASKEEMEIIELIVDRAFRLSDMYSTGVTYQDMMMDIEATHCNGCPLDLEALLKADDFNFCHDVFGIAIHLNRETGKLGDCFSPRFAKRGELK